MGNDEYSAAVGGGLKLKGAKPSGIEKKKKKKKATATATAAAALAKSGSEDPAADTEKSLATGSAGVGEDVGEDELRRLEEQAYGGGDDGDDGYDGKTPTERRHEEMKRKRLNERLLKTGAKTHKQRVEELNKYLSNLSEHHDMPRIGPG